MLNNLIFPIKSRNLISKYLPHREDMLLIDEIVSFDEKKLKTKAVMNSSRPFFRKGKTPSYVSFELIAQSISIYSHLYEYCNDDKPSIGFILRVSDFNIFRPFLRENEVVEIEVEEDAVLINDVFSFKGRVLVGEELIAKGALLVMHVGDQEILKRMVCNE